MRSRVLLTAVAALAAALVGGTAVAAPIDRYVIPGNAVFPEGIAVRPGSSSFFVSSAGDGTLYRGTLSSPSLQVLSPAGADGRGEAIGIKADGRGRLFVAGGASGRIWVQDASSGSLIRSFETGRARPAFINDVALGARGDAYFTDSFRPIIYRVPASEVGSPGAPPGQAEPWLDLTGTAIGYRVGFNLNGIAATRGGRHLLAVQTNTGRLFRITVGTKRVVEVDLRGRRLTNGDGLLLRRRALYAVRNMEERVLKIELSRTFASGRVVATVVDPSFAFPTTIASARGRLLVVNSQFDRRVPPRPRLPFTVSSVPLP